MHFCDDSYESHRELEGLRQTAAGIEGLWCNSCNARRHFTLHSVVFYPSTGKVGSFMFHCSSYPGFLVVGWRLPFFMKISLVGTCPWSRHSLRAKDEARKVDRSPRPSPLLMDGLCLKSFHLVIGGAHALVNLRSYLVPSRGLL